MDISGIIIHPATGNISTCASSPERAWHTSPGRNPGEKVVGRNPALKGRDIREYGNETMNMYRPFRARNS